MADVPLATYNRRIMTALRAMGYGDDILGPRDVPAGPLTDTDSFLAMLRDTMGIPSADIETAKQLADYKSGLGNNEPPKAPPGTSDITWRGVLQDYETSDRAQTMAENAPTPAAPAAPSTDHEGGAGLAKAAAAPAAPVTAPQPSPAATKPAGAAAAGGGGGGASTQISNPAVWNDDQIKTFIKSNFGANAYFVDIPEVWNALKNVVKNGQGVNGLEPALEGTQFYKQNTAAARGWYVKERSDPAQAAADIAQQTEATQNAAQQLGITLDPERAREISQSYLRYGWTQTDLQRALSAEWHYDPSSKQQAAAVTSMKQSAQNWLVPLSDQAIQTWGQGLMSGAATQDQFNQYLRDNAKSLFPQLASMIDAHAGDPNFDVSHFADPYKQTAANTLGITTDQIDLTDPKWRRALDQVDPKTGERRIMTLSEWQSTLKSDPQYGYDKTQNGVNDAMTLAKSLATSMGF